MSGLYIEVVHPILVIGVVAVASLSIAGIAVWFFWPGKAGKPVPGRRSVPFDEPGKQTAAITGDQKLTLTPEQMQGGALKVETAGERPTTEASGQLATGVVQANSYKETPVVSLVGGIVRSVR